MKRKLIFLLFSLVSSLVYGQTNTQEGNLCYDNGDYDCAISKYTEALRMASGNDKEKIEIRISEANWCKEHSLAANNAFNAKNYKKAKEEYQKVMDFNPKDSFAKSQIEKCDNELSPPEQIARTQDTPKPQQKVEEVAYLRLSKSKLSFTASGGISEQIRVFTDASSFYAPSIFIPSWCTVKVYNSYFTITADRNPNQQNRKDYLTIKAGGKEVRIDVEQSAATATNTHRSSSYRSKSNYCFNCPKTHYSWGLSAGYIERGISLPDFGYVTNKLEGYQVGIKYEPLFKYGFGLNTGLFFEQYFVDDMNSRSDDIINMDYEKYHLIMPLHLEYRFNFSRYFNLFVYGGTSLDYSTNDNFEENKLNKAYDFGGGLRIDHLQFNVGLSYRINDYSSSVNKDQREIKIVYSLSYMF